MSVNRAIPVARDTPDLHPTRYRTLYSAERVNGSFQRSALRGHVSGEVVMYADRVTDSMTRAIEETQRRRKVQLAHNEKHGIDPQTIRKAVGDILSMLRPESQTPVPGKDKRRQHERDKVQRELKNLPQQELQRLIQTLAAEMQEASVELKFEYAAKLRDEIRELSRELSDAG